jgi:hypothetical protein
MTAAMSKLQWLLVITAAVVALFLGAPHLKDGYVGYFLAGKCSEEAGARIPQCHVRVWGRGGYMIQ